MRGPLNRPSWIGHFLTVGFILACLVLAACATTGDAPAAAEEGGSGLSGRVVLGSSGQPLAGVYVYAYRDYSKNLMGVADFVSRRSSSDGAYLLDLPPGEYYVVARKRASGSNYGPIVTGDLYDHRFQEKAVRVVPGSYAQLDFTLTELKEPLFFQVFTEAARKTDTGIRGRIVDERGEPVNGAFATGYVNDEMKRLPDYASTVSDDDGHYTLYLPTGGRYFVGARSHARGVPEPGEPTGRYDGSEDHSVLVQDGTFVEGIDITLRPFASEPPKGYQPY